MSYTVLAEDSTATKLAPSLETMLEHLNKEDRLVPHDYFVALLIVFLKEAGFHLTCTGFCTMCRSEQYLHIPINWKSTETGAYDIRFRHRDLPDIDCKLVAVPCGAMLIINFFPVAKYRVSYSMAVQCLKYVNPFSSDLSGRYLNIKEISHRFKNELVTPVRSYIFTQAGRSCPSFVGLPTELKMKIFNYSNHPFMDLC